MRQTTGKRALQEDNMSGHRLDNMHEDIIRHRRDGADRNVSSYVFLCCHLGQIQLKSNSIKTIVIFNIFLV